MGNAIVRRLFGLGPFVGLISFAIAQFVGYGTADWRQNLLLISITYLVGVHGLVTGGGHLMFPVPSLSL